MTIQRISFAIGFLFLLAVSAFGQASFTSTTLSNAIDNKQTVFALASATGVSAPGLPTSQGGIGSSSGSALTVLYVDKEAMEVAAVNGTSVTVRRARQGTISRAHISGAKVWVGPGSYFSVEDPSGSCTAAVLTVLPRVVIPTGRLFNCGNGQWTTFDGSLTTIGAALASAGTIAPTNPVQHVTGTTTVNTITVPPACPQYGCRLTLIPDAIWSTGTSGNIAIASTGVVSKALILTYDPGTSKWYPSY